MPGGRGGSGGRDRPGAAEQGELVAGRYELTAFLGRGGLGEVWAGRDRRLHRDVAVKVFGRAGYSSAGLPDWLRREGITAAQITHPNVAIAHDQGTDELGRLYLVMELVTGASLHEVLAAGRLPLRDALGVGVQISEALAAAHAAGVVHRDVKPHNILITADGTVKMVDFGIAGFLSDTRSWSVGRSADAVKGSGTPDYAAPEQILGKRADARSDLYALGTLLFAMLAGQTPFQAETFLAVMHRKVTEDPPDVREQRSGLPDGLADVVRELLATDPEQRPGSARDIAQRLRDILFGLKQDEMSQPVVEVEAGIAAPIADDPVADIAAPAPAVELPGQVEDGVGAESQLEPEAEPEVEAEGADVQSESAAVPVAVPEAEPWRPPPADEVHGEASPAEPGRSEAGRSEAGGPEAGGPAAGRGQVPPVPAPDPTPPPEPAPPPVWGAAEARPADNAATTSATRLSPLSPPEIHGRSLLPPPPRSLLQEVPAQRFTPSPQAPAPAYPPGPPLLKTHETGRRILIWVTLTVLVVAAIGTVAVAVTRH